MKTKLHYLEQSWPICGIKHVAISGTYNAQIFLNSTNKCVSCYKQARIRMGIAHTPMPK